MKPSKKWLNFLIFDQRDSELGSTIISMLLSHLNDLSPIFYYYLVGGYPMMIGGCRL